jgi:hypothetical protein
MTRRKGEITRSDLKRKWPHHVVLQAEKVRGLDNSAMVRGFADTLSVAHDRRLFLSSPLQGNFLCIHLGADFRGHRLNLGKTMTANSLGARGSADRAKHRRLT